MQANETVKARYLVVDDDNNWLHTSGDPETLREAILQASEAGAYDADRRMYAYVIVDSGTEINCVPCFLGECCKGKICGSDCCEEKCECNRVLCQET